MTFVLLRYALGGDRPSQTAHHARSPIWIHRPGLEPRRHQGGISRLAPPELASWFHSLPPILHKSRQSPMQSYSKGSWGLSVLPRGDCIFTNISTSLSLRRRQCGHRYAIRAGRNLPDKEFRYLRMVIVTTAVYWGFNSKLHTLKSVLTFPLNLPAPGRRQCVYSALRLSTHLCF